MGGVRGECGGVTIPICWEKEWIASEAVFHMSVFMLSFLAKQFFEFGGDDVFVLRLRRKWVWSRSALRVWSWSDGSLCLGNKLHLSVLMGLYFPLIKERNWEQFLVATSLLLPASVYASPAFGIWVCGLGSFMWERMIETGFLFCATAKQLKPFCPKPCFSCFC